MMKVEIKKLDQLISNLKKSHAVKNNINTAIRNSVNVVTIAAKHSVPRGATGELSRSIRQEVDESKMIGVVGLDYPGRKYGLYVEKGTRPHWVPIAALKRWAEQRGISPYAIQKSIARKGTKKQPFLIPAYERNKSFIAGQFRKALGFITKDLKHGK